MTKHAHPMSEAHSKLRVGCRLLFCTPMPTIPSLMTRCPRLNQSDRKHNPETIHSAPLTKNKPVPVDGSTAAAPPRLSEARMRLPRAYHFVRGFARTTSVIPDNNARTEILPKRRSVSQIVNRITISEMAYPNNRLDAWM